jgi:hypothetical protein
MKDGRIKQEDFELHSTIPMTTLRFHLGSWSQAMKEAGIKLGGPSKHDNKPKPRSDTELLQDLIRLNEDSGEVPSLALIESKGKFSVKHYQERWKSINEAFSMAKKIFRGRVTPPPGSPLPGKMKEESGIDPYEITDTEKTLVQQPLPEIEPRFLEVEKEEPFDVRPRPTPKPPLKEKPAAGNKEPETRARRPKKVEFIPQTIKPKPPGKTGRTSGESVRFRGLLRAPANKQGVIYLFGMISYELGYSIKSVMTEFPDCEAKRCIDTANDKWKRLSLHFEYKSSDFLAHGHDAEKCDLIVCWNHDWGEAPIEVLELRSLIDRLPIE